MSMDKKSLTQIEHECGRSSHMCAPENECQIFYRLPFSYLKTHEERERDAWLSMQTVLEQVRASLCEPYSLMMEKDAQENHFLQIIGNILFTTG